MNDLFDSAPAAPDGIRVGIGGWTYAPWRGGLFYPQGLVQRRELEYASRHVSSIEINGTYYGTQKPDTQSGRGNGAAGQTRYALSARQRRGRAAAQQRPAAQCRCDARLNPAHTARRRAPLRVMQLQ